MFIGKGLAGVPEMTRNHEIQNQNSKVEKSAVTKSREQMSSDALSPKNDNRRAFASMDSTKSNQEANKMLQATNFAIVDHAALVKSVDEKGYVPGSVQNSIRSQVGQADAESAIANARMAHATTVFTPESNETQRHQDVYSIMRQAA